MFPSAATAPPPGKARRSHRGVMLDTETSSSSKTSWAMTPPVAEGDGSGSIPVAPACHSPARAVPHPCVAHRVISTPQSGVSPTRDDERLLRCRTPGVYHGTASDTRLSQDTRSPECRYPPSTPPTDRPRREGREGRGGGLESLSQALPACESEANSRQPNPHPLAERLRHRPERRAGNTPSGAHRGDRAETATPRSRRRGA